MGARTGATVRQAIPGRDDDAAARLMADYLTWAVRRLREEYGLEEPPTEPSRVRAELPSFQPPRGLVLLAEAAGRAEGVGALRRHAGGIAEVKRMYVEPEARGEHLGSALLDALIAEARSLGSAVVRLDTCRFMTDAQRLYRSRGFLERPAYPESEIPPHLQRHWLFFELDLAGQLDLRSR
jgi:GNAT superfamily N-acetyltransferase